MERPQILALEFLRQVLGGEPRQIRLEQLHAVLAEAAAVAGREDGQVSFVKLDARDTRVDLDPDDGLEVLAPDRVVAVHQVGVVLAVGALDPGRVTRRAEDVPRDALLEQVGDLLAVAVYQPAREIILDRALSLPATDLVAL